MLGLPHTDTPLDGNRCVALTSELPLGSQACNQGRCLPPPDGALNGPGRAHPPRMPQNAEQSRC